MKLESHRYRTCEATLEHLKTVAFEREARLRDPDLAERVLQLKHYQQARFERSYADLLSHPRYAAAARFFLDDLYGPTDFTGRDAQFARIVPAMTRMLPREVIDTVLALAALHALSEQLDTQMAWQLPRLPVDAPGYVEAWQRTGRHVDRGRQIDLMLAVGQALNGYTRNPLLRHTLRLMRAPARVAGLADLQTFLERGFDTFRAMRGADDFLATIEKRERAFASYLFTAPNRDSTDQLPSM